MTKKQLFNLSGIEYIFYLSIISYFIIFQTQNKISF